MLPILLALAFIGILLIIFLAGQPDEFVVSRSATLSAPPDKIFPHVNELRKWEAWNPWGNLDPNAKMTYDGPPAGVGAAYAWSGNNRVGQGRNTIIDSQPSGLVRLRLDFEKPMKATNIAEFTFRAEGRQTVVTWQMTGKNDLTGKVFKLLVNFDKMCGGQFEKGLASLKSVVENEASRDN